MIQKLIKSYFTKIEFSLQQMRLPTDSLKLWADAICINQADAEEKRSQVEIMRDIYVSAHQTWVWLGLPAADSDEAMGTVQKLHYPGLSPAELRQVSREAWDGIGNLMRRSWWTMGPGCSRSSLGETRTSLVRT